MQGVEVWDLGLVVMMAAAGKYEFDQLAAEANLRSKLRSWAVWSNTAAVERVGPMRVGPILTGL